MPASLLRVELLQSFSYSHHVLIYCGLTKKYPWAEHLTSLPKRGWVIFQVFQYLTMPMSYMLSVLGQQGQFAPGPHCKGAPKQCRTCLNKIRSSVTFQSSFLKGLYFRLKSACSFSLRFMLLPQIMHNYLAWLLHSTLAGAPYVILSI